MRILRLCAVALPLAAAGPALAGLRPILTAEQAIEAQVDGLRRVTGTGPCSRGAAAGDIVVCGRRGPDPSRLPLPVEPVPGEREQLLPGEVPRALTAYDSCMFGCQHPVTITDKDVRKYGGRMLRHILGKDD